MNDCYLFNAIPISSGGGMQKTLSLIEAIAGIKEYASSTVFVVRDSSPLQRVCVEYGLKNIAVNNGHLGRIIFEISSMRGIDDNSIVFNLGGLPTIGSVGMKLNVGECAYSNLFYPEIDFWSFLKGGLAIRAKFIDSVRKYLLTRLDFWVFQTEAIRRRAIEIFHFPPERCAVVKTAPSKLVSPERINEVKKAAYLQKFGGRFPLLALAGSQPNKRLHLLPRIARSIVDSSFNNFCVVLTIDEKSNYFKEIYTEFERLGVLGYLVNLGPVDYSDVPSLIDSSGAICLFSVLESFSNNFVEAWIMGKPLIVTDADWSREAARDSAMYVDPQNIEKTADSIRQLILNKEMQDSLIVYGYGNLDNFNSAENRVHEYYNILKLVGRLGKCPHDRRPNFKSTL